MDPTNNRLIPAVPEAPPPAAPAPQQVRGRLILPDPAAFPPIETTMQQAEEVARAVALNLFESSSDNDDNELATLESSRFRLSPEPGPARTLTPTMALRLRASQDSVSCVTGGGITLEALGETFATEGWDPTRDPLKVVKMPGTDMDPVEDGANHHLVSFDNRRRSALMIALRQEADPGVVADVHTHDEPAVSEYKNLKKFAKSGPRSIPQHIRNHIKNAWRTWNDPVRLRKHGITPRSWGHCIKIRMAMGAEKGDLAKLYNGFHETPKKRRRGQKRRADSPPPSAHEPVSKRPAPLRPTRIRDSDDFDPVRAASAHPRRPASRKNKQRAPKRERPTPHHRQAAMSYAPRRLPPPTATTTTRPGESSS